MKRLLTLSADYPWLTFLVLAALSLLAATQAPKVRFDVAATEMLVVDNPELDFYQRTLETFGDDEVILAYFEDARLFSPSRLKALRDTLARIEALPAVASVESLFNLANIRSVDGEIKSTPYLATVPDEPAELNAIVERALNNPFLAGNLVSPSAKAMTAVIHLRNGLDGTAAQTASTEIDALLAALSPKLDRSFQLGEPFIHAAISEHIARDMTHTLPLSLAVLLIALALALRRSSGFLLPLLTAGMSVLWTLGMMAALDIALNVITSIVPALLIVIGSTEDIHLLSEYYTERRQGRDKSAAVRRMTLTMGSIVGLTFFTTYLGFLSITINDIGLLRQFGVVASTGLLFNFLITLLLVPAALSLFGAKTAANEKKTEGELFARLAEKTFLAVNARKTSLTLWVAAVTVVAATGIATLKVDNTTLGYFDEDSELNRRVDTLQSNLAGMETLSVVLDSGIDDTFLKIKYLEEVKKIQDYLSDSGFADVSLSFVDYISFLHAAIEEDDSGDIYLPEDDSMVREYMLFVDHDQVRGYLSDDFSQARILVRHRVSSSHELNRRLAEIKRFTTEHVDAGLKVQVTGDSVLAAQAADYMVTAQTQSLALMILVIFVVMSIVFFSPKAGLLAIIPNLVPIIILFGVMGFSGIPLNTGTAMTATIALGICVDDTMHFMMRYNHLAKSGADKGDILIRSVRREAVPILTTSIALAMGFAVMMTSSFPPIVHFGALSAFVILMAVIATFVLTPTLLSAVSLITIWDVLALKLKRDVIERSPLLRDMTPLQMRKAVLHGHISEHAEGAQLIKQGDVGDRFYMLLDGEAIVSKQQSDGSTNRLDKMRAGDVFGEIALVSRQPRMASVVATRPVTLLSFDRDAMTRVGRLNPRIAARLFSNISGILGLRFTRLTRVNPMIVDDSTGALKHTVFELILDKEISSAVRYREPLTLLMIDAGDTRPERIADIATEQLRSNDHLCRWKGSRFALLMPRTRVQEGEVLKQRLLNALGHAADIHASLLQLEDGEDRAALISRAQRALEKHLETDVPPNDV